MSTNALDLTNADIERMRAEDDPEPDPEPEQDPEPEPEPEPQAISEKDVKAMEREESRHEAAVDKLLGQASDSFHRCPLCATFPSGFVPIFATVPDEVAAQLGTQVFEYFNGPELVEPQYVEGHTMTRCTFCDGWGQVRSGARNQLHRVEQCPDCLGNGYVARVQLQAVPTGAPTLAVQVSAEAPQPAPYRDWQGNPCYIQPDTEGRAWGDPLYGQPAQTVGVNQ